MYIHIYIYIHICVCVFEYLGVFTIIIIIIRRTYMIQVTLKAGKIVRNLYVTFESSASNTCVTYLSNSDGIPEPSPTEQDGEKRHIYAETGDLRTC